MNQETNQEPVTAMSATHKPTVALRFILRDGKRILQQQYVPVSDWDSYDIEWRDVRLEEQP